MTQHKNNQTKEEPKKTAITPPVSSKSDKPQVAKPTEDDRAGRR